MKNNVATGAFRLNSELIGRLLTMGAAIVAIISVITIVSFITVKGMSTFIVSGVSVKEFLFSTNWYPDRLPENGGPQVGVLVFIFGSIIIAALAVLLSAPLSIACAVFMSEIAPFWGQRYLQPSIELLAGFLVLSIMIMPTIVSVLTDSLRALPREYKEAALALGSTRWQSIRHVLIPAARSGLITGIVLGLARAFGEALAVQMVIGNMRKMPTSIMDPVITLTSAITMDMGNTPMGSLWNNALWSMGLFTLMMSCFFILVLRFIVRKGGVVR